MAVRPEMQYLIDYVRELINDSDDAGSEEYFTDQQIQDRLDQHCLDAYMLELTAANSLSLTGTYERKDFYAPHPFWEGSVLIQKSSGPAVVPTTLDYRKGKFVYATAQTECLYITGRCYNVYMACSGLCFQMEAKVRNQFNFTADGLTVQRISQVRDLHAQGVTFAALGFGGVGGGTQLKLVRKDIVG